MTETTRVREYFEGIAETYFEQRYGAGAGPWRACFFGGRLRQVLDLLGPTTGIVLDLGSGPGILRKALEATGAQVVQVDLSPAMLARAGGDAVAGDALRIPLLDGTVDTVVALGLTTYLPDLDPLLIEVRRVLRPRGRLVLSYTRRASPDTMLRGAYRATLGRLSGSRGILRAGLGIRSWSDGQSDRALVRAGFTRKDSRHHNFTVFPFAYLLEGASIRLSRVLEQVDRPALRSLASDAIVLAKKDAELRQPRRERRIRVVRMIARLNVGGPARQAILLSERLDPSRFETTLVTGRVARHEGDMTDVARAKGFRLLVLRGLGRAISVIDDVRAFLSILSVLRHARPDIVHTHTAKAGALGRIAAFLLGVPVRFHTFHGHVLHGYFGRLGSTFSRAAERVLARTTTRVIAVSKEVKEDLAGRHRVVPASRVEVVPLGLDLGALLDCESRRGELREELRLPEDAPLVGFIGRVTSVKEPWILLETARRVRQELPEARFLVVGGGELLEATKRQAAESGLADGVRFLGWRSDLDRILADLDLALLTSRNEGTPVALIEAAAAGVPAVATRVGGVPSVVLDGVTGLLATAGDAEGLASAVIGLLRDPERRQSMGAAARERVRVRFSAKRLLRDIEKLYLLSLPPGRRGSREHLHGRGRIT